MDPLTLNPSAPFSPWSIEVQVEQISPAIHPSLLRVVFLLSLVIVWNSVDFCIPLEDWSDLPHHRVLFSSSLDYYIYALLANMLTSLYTKLPSETLFLCAISLFHTIQNSWERQRQEKEIMISLRDLNKPLTPVLNWCLSGCATGMNVT